MRVVLSFDDGRMDQYQNGFKTLLKHNLVGSFHIATGYIDGRFSPNNLIGSPKPMKIENIVEMKNAGMEISSHGDMHIFEPKDYLSSIKIFNDWGLKIEKCGISIPNSSYNKEIISTFLNQTNDCVKYIRVGRYDQCYALLNKIRFALYSVFKSNSLYSKFNKYNLTKTLNRYQICSLVIKKNSSVRNLINFIKKNLDSNYLLVIMFHSIVDKPKTKWEWSSTNFDILCTFLSVTPKIKVDTLENFIDK